MRLAIGAALLWGCAGALNALSPAAPVHAPEVVRVFPHDPQAFTQGLAFARGMLYEGTGLHGQSTVRRVALESGRVLALHRLPRRFFGEGIAVYAGRVVQLTWRSGVGFVYEPESLVLRGRFRYPAAEGWGIAYDGRRLIMSDGTATLRFLDPERYTEIGRIQVTDAGRPVNRLNELEHVAGEIYANVWRTARIARIDPESGRVLGWLDLGALRDRVEAAGSAGVANGIAYDAHAKRLFVTGKRWPHVFELELASQD